jgi:multicomponent K+:H+ antiporter subunit F
MSFLSAAIAVTQILYAMSMALALFRLWRGPATHDRVLALDFITVVGMLLLLVLAIRYRSSTYFEAALLLALFGFAATASMAKFLLRGEVIE